MIQEYETRISLDDVTPCHPSDIQTDQHIISPYRSSQSRQKGLENKEYNQLGNKLILCPTRSQGNDIVNRNVIISNELIFRV